MDTRIGDWIEFFMGERRTLGVVRAIGAGEVAVDSNGERLFVPTEAIREVRPPASGDPTKKTKSARAS